MKNGLTRREFFRRQLNTALAAVSFPSIVPASVFARDGVAPNSRIQVGCIGVGPQGRSVMGGFLAQADARVIALCDVAKRNRDAALNQVRRHYKENGCSTYGDFRELLARADIDAVLIATPDHWHVPVAVAAAAANKDLYLEKPMGLSVAEDQKLRALVHKNKRIFQFGTQQRSGREFRRACELLRNGRIGKLKQINVWSAASRPGGSTEPAAVPPDLDYEFWLGPAPQTPFTVDKCFDVSVPGAWKTWWFNQDYALGFIAGWGVHPLDIAYWGHPAMFDGAVEVEGKGIFPSAGACNTAVAWDVNFKFADGVSMSFRGTRNGAEACPMNDLSAWQNRYQQIADHGTAFEGTDGWVLVHRGALRTSPASLAEEHPGQIRLTESSNHVRNFLDSIRSRQPAICHIDDAVQADILCQLSDIAARLNRKLSWDPAQEKFVNDAEADRRLGLRPMRDPWKLAS